MLLAGPNAQATSLDRSPAQMGEMVCLSNVQQNAQRNNCRIQDQSLCSRSPDSKWHPSTLFLISVPIARLGVLTKTNTYQREHKGRT